MRRNNSGTFLIVIALSMLLSGCASTLVDFRVRLDVSYLDADGSTVNTKPTAIVEVPLDTSRLGAFPDTEYRDRLLSWVMTVDSTTIAVNRISNQSGQPLTLRWDEAHISSSQHAGDTQLLSYHSIVGGQLGGPRRFVPGTDDRLHALAPLHLAPGQVSRVAFGARYDKLFDSGRLFGVRYESGSTHLQEAGIGEWLLIKLPVEHGEDRYLMHIKLTALDAEARTVTHIF